MNNPIGLVVQARVSQQSKEASKGVDAEEPICSGPEYPRPPSFEKFIGVVGPSSQEYVHGVAIESPSRESRLRER